MVYRILLKDKVDRGLLEKIRAKHREDIEGISELYDELIEKKVCNSSVAKNIYYVAYTLALENIEIIIVRVN